MGTVDEFNGLECRAGRDDNPITLRVPRSSRKRFLRRWERTFCGITNPLISTPWVDLSDRTSHRDRAGENPTHFPAMSEACVHKENSRRKNRPGMLEKIHSRKAELSAIKLFSSQCWRIAISPSDRFFFKWPRREPGRCHMVWLALRARSTKRKNPRCRAAARGFRGLPTESFGREHVPDFPTALVAGWAEPSFWQQVGAPTGNFSSPFTPGLIRNLPWSTMGNIIGGSATVLACWRVYRRNE